MSEERTDLVKEGDVETELRPILARFAKERNSSERFGDWCDRDRSSG